jgi:teichuronic acid biosynthesis glycosyltransferase TuaH
MEIKGKDIVIIGLQPWYYEIGSNCKNIALQMTRHNRVLYVNLPVNRKTYYSKLNNEGLARHCEIIRSKGQTIFPIKENLWEFYPPSVIESINWLPSTSLFRVLNYYNNYRFAADLKRAFSTLGFKDIILFNDNDIFNGYYLKELLSPVLSIYYMRDFLQGFDYWKKHCTTLEPEPIRKADIVVTNSIFYQEYCSAFNRQSFYIGQGCNLDIFDAAKSWVTPEDIRSIEDPVIGYVGAIESIRLDMRILTSIAESRPDWTIVMVGPEDQTFRQSSLHQLPNVHFLGRRPMEQLPDYIRAFTVCINPQLSNNVTRGNYPLKIDEYLALGKPVVATRTPTMQLFVDHVWLADAVEDYIPLIERAIEGGPSLPAQRIAFASSHSWENSVAILYRTIAEKLPS